MQPPARRLIRYNKRLLTHATGGQVMTQTERDILRHFRTYHIGVNEMLCFNTTMSTSNSTKFQSAINALVRDGLVVKERLRGAYSLTPEGFTQSMSA
jgi:hypothetical protein